MKNRYIYRAKISEIKFRQLVKLFCLDLTASQIAEITGFNRNTINRYMTEIRHRIFEHCSMMATEDRFPFANDEKSKKISNPDVLEICTEFVGLSIENGKVRCRMINSRDEQNLRQRNGIEKKYMSFREIPGIESCEGLIDLGRMKYIKLKPMDDGINRRGKGIDLCIGFWGAIRGRVLKLRGLRKSTLPLHIRECEFRFNHHQKELYPLLLEIIRNRPLFQ